MLLLHVIKPPSYERHLYVRTPRWYERKLRAGGLGARHPLFTFRYTDLAELLYLGMHLWTYSVVWALRMTFVPSHTLLISFELRRHERHPPTKLGMALWHDADHLLERRDPFVHAPDEPGTSVVIGLALDAGPGV